MLVLLSVVKENHSKIDDEILSSLKSDVVIINDLVHQVQIDVGKSVGKTVSIKRRITPALVNSPAKRPTSVLLSEDSRSNYPASQTIPADTC